jgi:hypothetical protein
MVLERRLASGFEVLPVVDRRVPRAVAEGENRVRDERGERDVVARICGSDDRSARHLNRGREGTLRRRLGRDRLSRNRGRRWRDLDRRRRRPSGLLLASATGGEEHRKKGGLSHHAFLSTVGGSSTIVLERLFRIYSSRVECAVEMRGPE